VAAGQLLPASDRELLLAELRTELARRRRALGLSQAGLAGRMGFDRTTVNKVERGAIEPSREFARQAERALEAGGELWRRWSAFDAARRRRPIPGRQVAGPAGPPPPSGVATSRSTPPSAAGCRSARAQPAPGRAEPDRGSFRSRDAARRWAASASGAWAWAWTR
jgi:transcriptional regulator with XRE-family HTH domain